ncbi:MAG TPA: ABC transporter permease [Gemmatimonadaceae bacterium]|nr:ABC transporter permease [Gemmatimonadaceae bacterium]
MNEVKPERDPAWRRYLRFWGSDPECDIDDELRFHFEARVDEYIAAGLTPEDALAEATKRFGSLARVREQCTHIDSQWTRERTMLDTLQTFIADLRFAVRQLRRTPALTVAAVLCFALGIGANTSIFSVVDAVLFRPLPFHEPNRLVLVGEQLPRFGPDNFGVISRGEYSDYARLDGRTFARWAIYEIGAVALTGDGEPERVDGIRSSAALFDVLGVMPRRGRGFTATDTLSSSPDVAVLSDALWRRRYRSDPAIVGRSIDMDGKPTTIVGIAPPGFEFPLGGDLGQPAEAFLLMRLTAADDKQRANAFNTFFVARLADGVTPAHARAAVNGVAKGLAAAHPEAYPKDWSVLADVLPLRDRAVKDVRGPLLILLAAVGAVLLIACINVSSLLIARIADRRREIAVRQALGASRRRLVQQFLAESLVLVAIGGALGLAFAAWGARALAAHAPHELLEHYAPTVDVAVLAVTGGIVALTTLAFSIVPVLVPERGALGAALRDDSRSATGGRRRRGARQMLVVAEIALALMLAAVAGLMVRSFVRVRGVQPGFDVDHAVTVRVGLPPAHYRGAADMIQFEQRIIERLVEIPGVRVVSATNDVPMGDNRVQFALGHEGQTSATTPIGAGEIVYPRYFDAMGMRVLDGRPITASDAASSLKVVVVNQTLARQFFGNGSVIGRRLKSGGVSSPAPWLTIVGVVPDVREEGIDKPVLPEVFFPALQTDTSMIQGLMRTASYVVRTDGSLDQTMNEMRRAIHELDPQLPLVGLQPLSNIIGISLGERTFNTVLLGAFAVLALVLAAVGIYGLIAYAVVQRTREIGIRLAIGATPSKVLGLVVADGTRLAAAGVAIGLAGAFALTRLMRSVLFDVAPFDPLAIVGASAVLFGVAALASWLPARRAARIDPLMAMRAD